MRIVVIGGSGHIGTFLVPRLVHAGHEVVNISHGQRSCYIDDPIWQHLRHVTADRAVEDHEGTFPSRVAGLQPDVVIDLICFTLDSAMALVERLRGYAQIAASWFGQNAVLRSVTWDEFRRSTNDEAAQSSWDHLVRNHYFSIDKACTLLGYTPQYQPEDAVLESVRWLIDHEQLDLANPLRV